MNNKKNGPPKAYPFAQPALTTKNLSNPPTTPRKPTNGKISQRGLLSVLTLILGLGGLSTALAGGGKLILDILNEGLMDSLDLIGVKGVVLGLAYLFGWLFAAISIRVYGNLILPAIIRVYSWVTLAGACILYMMVLDRLFRQSYDLPHYWAYLITVASGLAALVGLHLILEEHDLRPYAIPLFVISLMQIGLIVVRYVFTQAPNPLYLWGDLFFFFSMVGFSGLMVAHLGLLSPFRQRITKFFDSNSRVIRPDS
jgi:hypothetical protein